MDESIVEAILRFADASFFDKPLPLKDLGALLQRHRGIYAGAAGEHDDEPLPVPSVPGFIGWSVDPDVAAAALIVPLARNSAVIPAFPYPIGLFRRMDARYRADTLRLPRFQCSIWRPLCCLRAPGMFADRFRKAPGATGWTC